MELYGLRAWPLADARDLATEGYAVLVPDLYSGMGTLRFCFVNFSPRLDAPTPTDPGRPPGGRSSPCWIT